MCVYARGNRPVRLFVALARPRLHLMIAACMRIFEINCDAKRAIWTKCDVAQRPTLHMSTI
jgi:hypothetical protein